ncbi:MAG: flagellar basal-body rod protein FlgG [Planctomycetes bacterium]|nr:flagellar basal-body rod protein FlgG [Planctomycetota bacterium]
MIRAFHTSATGMNAQQIVLDNTANNLANMNTAGFKTSQVDFQDLIYTTLRQPGADSVQGQQIPTGLQLGHGVRVAGNTRHFAVGNLQATGNDLDVAIEGIGFFKITNPAGGFRYTRDGGFRLTSNKELVTSDGFFLEPRITLPQDTVSVSVGTDGTVTVITAGSPTTATQVGRLTLTRFPNPAGLSAEGRNLFAETPASGTATDVTPGQQGTGLVRSGFLEGSNVEVVTELVNMIQAQRAYEFNTKAIKVADEMLSFTNDLVR